MDRRALLALGCPVPFTACFSPAAVQEFEPRQASVVDRGAHGPAQGSRSRSGSGVRSGTAHRSEENLIFRHFPEDHFAVPLQADKIDPPGIVGHVQRIVPVTGDIR